MSLVLDSSVTIAWAYNDETTLPMLEVFDPAIIANGAWVPSYGGLRLASSDNRTVRQRAEMNARSWRRHGCATQKRPH